MLPAVNLSDVDAKEEEDRFGNRLEGGEDGDLLVESG